MILYLNRSTHPDILYTVHQCARLSYYPNAYPEIEVKHIARYLKGTRDKSLIVKPNVNNLELGLFDDSDFTGLFGAEDKMDSISAKIKTYLILNFGEVHIFLRSKLQSEVALSTLEAVYIMLSQDMRKLVAARSLVLKLGSPMKYNLKSVPQVSKMWEDNVGTHNLENSKGYLMTSRTMLIRIK